MISKILFFLLLPRTNLTFETGNFKKEANASVALWLAFPCKGFSLTLTSKLFWLFLLTSSFFEKGKTLTLTNISMNLCTWINFLVWPQKHRLPLGASS